MRKPDLTPTVRPLPAGTRAPPIQLPDQLGAIVNIDQTGAPVLLAFHPLAWTDASRDHINALEARAWEFRQAGVTVYAVSADPVPSQRAWRESLELRFVRLLSDFWPHGEAARALGLFHEGEGVSERATVLIDASGTIRLNQVHTPAEVPDVDAIVASLDVL